MFVPGWSTSRLITIKHSSLFGTYIIYEEKSFTTLAIGGNVMKLVLFVTYAAEKYAIDFYP
jgi:hypothetical protein